MSGTGHRPFSTEPVGFRRDSGRRFVVVGGGAAGLSAAAAIRARDNTAAITLVGAEPHASYSRPMLTKAPLIGFDPSVFAVFGPEWYEEHQIECIAGVKVVSVDAKSCTVILDDGGVLPYDRCVLATGAACALPPVAGAALPGVHPVRTLDDMAAIRRSLPGGGRAVIVGGGVVGLEMAWELARAGFALTVLEAAPALMSRLLDGGTARRLQERLEAAGVTVRTGAELVEITGGEAADGVVLADGSRYPADLVVACCGIRPRTGLAAAAGAELARAVKVNRRMETSVPGLYACGDCAQVDGVSPGTWPVAVEQGRVAGANGAGDALEYIPLTAGVVLHGFGTALYAVGDMTGGETAVEVERWQGREPGFLVNPCATVDGYGAFAYDRDGVLRGGVLMDDLRGMAALDKAIAQEMSREQFHRMREEGHI